MCLCIDTFTLFWSTGASRGYRCDRDDDDDDEEEEEEDEDEMKKKVMMILHYKFRGL